MAWQSSPMAKDEAALQSAFQFADKRYNPELWVKGKGEEWFELLSEIKKEFPNVAQ